MSIMKARPFLREMFGSARVEEVSQQIIACCHDDARKNCIRGTGEMTGVQCKTAQRAEVAKSRNGGLAGGRPPGTTDFANQRKSEIPVRNQLAKPDETKFNDLRQHRGSNQLQVP
jgi:hypothetical protein